MSFVVRKLPLAEEDALGAALWYEERQTGLGEEFDSIFPQLSACGRASLVYVAPRPAGSILEEVDRAVCALSESALHHRIRFADVRRAAMPRFKFYGIYYTVSENEVWILAIFHGRRHPRVLHERTERVS